jgi:hypothetical protein
MIRRRTAQAGFKVKLGCHVFRATGITAYLEAGGSLETPRPWRRTKPAHHEALRPHLAMKSRLMRWNVSQFNRDEVVTLI